jgi:hypothetical protein
VKLFELMAAEKLLEMPMVSYKTHGDFSPGIDDDLKHFANDIDRKLVTSEKHPARVANFFKNITQDIRIFVVNNPKFRIAQRGLVKPSLLDKLSPEIKQDLLDGHEDCITLIYTGNRGADGSLSNTGGEMMTPMTAWTFGHKLMHMIDESGEFKFGIFTDKLADCFNISTGDPSKEIMNKAVTALSGKQNNINEYGEMLAELGTIWLNKGYSNFGDLTGVKKDDGESYTKQEAAELKENVDSLINEYMTATMKSMVGKMYCVKP